MEELRRQQLTYLEKLGTYSGAWNGYQSEGHHYLRLAIRLLKEMPVVPSLVTQYDDTVWMCWDAHDFETLTVGINSYLEIMWWTSDLPDQIGYADTETIIGVVETFVGTKD